MRRLTIGLGLGAAVIVSALSAIPWTLSGRSIRQQVVEQLHAATGVSANMPTRITFSLLPRPRVKMENFSLNDEHGGLSLTAKIAKGDLRLLPLARGAVELSSLTLLDPHIVVDADRRPLQTEGAIARASAAQPASEEAASADSSPLAILRITHGELEIQSAAHGLRAKIKSVDAVLDWPSPGAPASLRASGDWRGRRVDVTAWLGQPAAVMRKSGSSPVKVELKSDFAAANFDGQVGSGVNWRLEGRADLQTDGVSALADWLGPFPDLPRKLGSAALDGRMVTDKGQLIATDLALSIGGSRFEGEASLDLQRARPLLSATLASDALNLTPYLADAPPISDSDGAWSSLLLPKTFGNLDLDLRISAAEAKLDRVEMADLGLAILKEAQRFEVSLPEAKAYGGSIKGRLTLDCADGQQTLTASGEFDNVEAGGLLWDAADSDLLNGSASGRFSVEARGRSIADLVRSLSGDAEFRLSKGQIVGLDFEQALRRIEKRPLSVASEVHGGQTNFDAFSGRLVFGNDKAELQNVQLSGPGADVRLSGQSLLAERELDVRALARQAGDDGAPSAGGSRLAVQVEGQWDDPRLDIDAASLVRRSEAAAPLFAPTADSSQGAREP